jgi:hypothetical protein
MRREASDYAVSLVLEACVVGVFLQKNALAGKKRLAVLEGEHDHQ